MTTPSRCQVDADEFRAVVARVVPAVERQTGQSLRGLKVRQVRVEELASVLANELIVAGPADRAKRAGLRRLARSRAQTLFGKFFAASGQVLICANNLEVYARVLGQAELRGVETLCAVVAHECVHAADERRFGWSKRRAAQRDPLREPVWDALLEGHAQWCSREVCRASGWLKGFDAYTAAIGKTARHLDTAQQALVRAELADQASAYHDGEEFVRALIRERGVTAVARAFTDPPQDFALILHSDWYLDPSRRPAPRFDLDRPLGSLDRQLPRDWHRHRHTTPLARLRLSLRPLPDPVILHALRGLRQSRSSMLRSPAGGGASVTATLFEFESPAAAASYGALCGRLTRIKDRKMKSGALQLLSAEYVAVPAPGVLSRKKLRTPRGDSAVTLLVEVRGPLVLELFLADHELDTARLRAVAKQLLDAAQAARLAPPPADAPVK
ncbi:MAG: hypothetical protein H6837_04290 [Planctomycetes bacterium]|nr:hypothetical protein [Planctomycetota bacterium]